MSKENSYICVDFDGTCTTHDYPRIGVEIGAEEVLLKLVENGHKLILFTMRSGKELNDAVNWFKKHKIELYGIQTNPTQKHWTSSPKAYGHLYIDDAALGCPLKIDESISSRPFVDWDTVEELLFNNGYIKFKPQISPKDIDYSKVVVTKIYPEKDV